MAPANGLARRRVSLRGGLPDLPGNTAKNSSVQNARPNSSGRGSLCGPHLEISQGKAGGRVLQSAVSAALTSAWREAAVLTDGAIDDGWVAEVTEIWRPAFTSEVVAELIVCCSDLARDRALLVRIASRTLGTPDAI